MRLHRYGDVVKLRWRSLVQRRAVERDMDDELRDHLDRRIEEYVARGLGAEQARRRALVDLGGLDQVKEECRDARGVGLVETTIQDIRYGARALRRDAGFSIVAVLTLALGMGANTAVFSLVDGILLAPLPYPAPDRLVSVTGTYPQGAFDAMRREVRSFDAAAYVEGKPMVLKGVGEPVRLSGTRVSAEFFTVLGAAPAIGRRPGAGEDRAGRDRVVVLSHALWAERFRGDPTAVGRSIEIDGVRREIIAVMPPSFRFPSARTELWVPLGLDERDVPRYWAGDFMPILGRLRPDATLAGGRAEIRTFDERVRGDFPWRMPDDWNKDVSLTSLRDALAGPMRERLLILLAAVLVVLVTACANVANLSLSRAIAREREIAVRVAVGAGPRRIARQLLTESVMLALVAAGVGVLVGAQMLGVLKSLLPPDTPRLFDVEMNWRVLVFSGALAVVTGLAFGLAPVLRALRVRLAAALEAGGRGGGRAMARGWRAALAVAQVACAVLLVIAAGLLVRSLWSLSRSDPGFRVDDVQVLSISPAESACAEPARCLAFYHDLEDRVQVTPGITNAALVNTLPLTGAIAKRALDLEGYSPPDANAPLFWLNVITPEYFRVMDIRMESGRGFGEGDRSGARVAIVSASTARRFWPGESPLGRHVRFVGEPHWHQIVGVVADVRAHDLNRARPDWIDGVAYVPYGPAATLEDGTIPAAMALTVRTGLDARQTASAVRQAASALGADGVVSEARPMRAVVAEAVATPAAVASLLATMAGVALVLGAIGVYGVLSFLVARQMRDFGIRLALGATPRTLCWLVIREGGTLCLAGTAIGVAGALGFMRWLASELHGVSPTDPVTYTVVVAGMAAVTLVASVVPTRRAMRVNLLSVLRDA